MLLGVVLFSLLHCIPLYVGSGITVLGFHGLILSVGVVMLWCFYLLTALLLVWYFHC